MSGKRQNLRDRPRTSKKRREETEMFLKQSVEDRTENQNMNMIEEIVVETQDYFYTRKKRSSRRTKRTTMSSKQPNNTQLSNKKSQLQSEIYDLERDFCFLPENINEYPNEDIQTIIQERITALDILTNGIRDLTQKYLTQDETEDINKDRNDGMSDLTTDELLHSVKQAHTHTPQQTQECENVDNRENQTLTIPLEQFKQHDRRYTVLTDTEKHLLKLYKLCINNSVPKDMFDNIINIFRDAYLSNEENFNEMFQHTRVSLTKRFKSIFPGGEPINEGAMLEVETKKIITLCPTFMTLSEYQFTMYNTK